MKMKSIKNSKPVQKGFAMLEVMLAILIIAIASFGIYKLYSTSAARNSVATTVSNVSQVGSAISQYAATYMKQPTAQQLVDVGYITADIFSGSTVHTPLGDGTLAFLGSSYDAYTLSFGNIPNALVVSFVRSMLGACEIKIGDTPYDGSTNPTLSGSTSAVTLTCPKGQTST